MPELTRKQVQEIVAKEREAGNRPDLSRRDLSGLNLSGLDLSDVNFLYSNCQNTNFRGSDCQGAYFFNSDCSGAIFGEANCQNAIFQHSNCQDANFYLSNCAGVKFQYTDCRRTFFRGLLRLQGLPSGPVVFKPTPAGWELEVGCWDGTPDTLERLIATDEGWPEAVGDECAERRPGLEAVVALCRAQTQIGAYRDYQARLRDYWAERDEKAAEK